MQNIAGESLHLSEDNSKALANYNSAQSSNNLLCGSKRSKAESVASLEESSSPKKNLKCISTLIVLGSDDTYKEGIHKGFTL